MDDAVHAINSDAQLERRSQMAMFALLGLFLKLP